MTCFYILKTARYNPIKNGLSKYESLDLVARGEYSPPVIADTQEILSAIDQSAVKDADFIFHSPFLRTRQTAELLKGALSPKAILVETPFLSEVHFSLKDLVSKDEYEKEGSNLVRKRFIEIFASNRSNLTMKQCNPTSLHLASGDVELRGAGHKRFTRFVAGNETMESRESIQRRITGFLKLLRKKEYQNQKLVAVSHSFFIKVLQIYFLEPTLFENPQALLKHFDWRKRTFEFCQGFYFDYN